MDSLVSKSILAGILATIAMTIVTFMAPIMGLPEMSPPQMLSGMMGTSIAVGWVMHFMVGIIFAIGYSYLFAPAASISNIWIKGLVFGIVVFIFAQIAMKIMGAMFEMPPMDGSMILMMVGSLIGHIVYGIVVAQIFSASSKVSTT